MRESRAVVARRTAPASLGAASPDGKRFLFAIPVPENRREEFTVVLNWQSGLKE
jgi:hypothetical protein